ncbi:uncharacterized protein arhgef5 isoform X2 [Genypterus blacodes]|uniref:uncharacterized protein arhgef5 isoform X2 n=1 Tax=Genypterus blacodes TaxID=154954 RepID=UPI003F763228
MGTKRPNWTLLDTLSNINMTDRKHQPGGKTTRDPSPRPGMTAQSERERDRNQEGEWRRESEMEKMRDKTRHKGKELDPREQYSERDCAPVPTREGEREWRERQKRREADRRRNGRPISNLETKPAKDIEGKMKKGDTFPRMRKERYTAKDEDIGVKRQMDRQRRVEVDDWERKREGTWQRDRDTEREQPRERERGDTQSRAKGVEDGRVERRERRREAEPGRRERDLGVSDLPGRRERDATRKREKLRPDEGKKKARFPSPFRRRDRENYSDEERGKAQRTEERRDTRSEGDTDETEIKRERARDRQREEMIYQHSKSEGDNKGELAKERDRNRSREEDRPRYRQGDAETSKRPSDGRERGAEKDKERYRDNDRRPVRDGERWKDRHDDRARPDDRRVAGLHGERTHDKRRDRGGRGREAEHRYDNATGRSSRPPSETAARVPPRAQSSGEWSSDMDSERRSRQGRDSYEERELGRDSTDRNERDVEETTGSDRAGERRWKEQKRGERPDRQGGQGRKMWLEPKGKNSKESSLEEEVVQTETCKRQSEEARSMESHGMGEGWRVKEEQDERYLDKSDSRGRRYDTETSRRQEYKDQGGEAERETEGVSLEEEEVGEARRKRDKAEEEHLSDSDGGEEGGWFRDAERENATDDTEESDTEEEEGSDYCARCGSEGVSEAGSDRDRMLSTGDSFVTVSSGGDGEDEREEEEFQDCSEFLEGGVPPAGFRQREGDDEWRGRKEERVEENEEGKVKHSKYVYCVIGQTLPRSKSNQMPQLDQVGGAESNNPNLESSYGGNDVTQRPQHDLHLTVSGGDEHTTNNPSNNEATEEGTFGDETSRADVRYRASSQGHDTETGKRSEVKVEHPYAVIGPTSRDSQTEKLLVQWRERNKDLAEENKEGLLSHPDNPCAEIQDPFVGIDTRTMTPEEEEAIRIRMSGAWSISEEPKRHSQAPHLKWAKNVVCEILGSSDEKTIDDPSSGSEGDQCANWPKAAIEKDKQGEESTDGIGEMPFYASVQKPRIEEEPTEPGSDEEEPELEGLRDDEDCRSKSWGELDLRSVMDTLTRRRRNSKFFNAAQLYQQYSEAAQNIEILRQSRSDTLSVCYDTTQLPALSPSSSPIPSPPPARRPLPPLPPVPHPHSLAHTGSLTSAKTLPLPEPPSSGRRSSSPRLSVSLTQSSTLWRELPGVRNSVELEELTEDQRRLQEVRFEVVTSEASYCRSLDIVVEHFVKSKQLGTLLTTQDRNWLFSRLADVRAISHNFLSKLEERVDSDIFFFTVCDIIARQCQRFRMVYVPYLTNQSYQDATYQRLMNVNPGFKRIVEKLERSAVCQRLPLRSFLVLPFQRITRIKLLVQNIVKRTTPGTPESMQAIKALKLLEKLIQESNDSITQMKSIESLVSLSAKVDFECRTLPLISQARRLVREGSVTELMDFSLKDTERNIYLHLFNDYLLVSLQKEGGKLTVIDHAPVSDLRAENCRVKLHSLKKNLFRLHLTQKALLLRTETLSDKLRWISAVSLSHPEIDFSAAQDFEQMQCIRAFIAQQPDELSLEKADIILVHQQSTDGWVEGTKLSDRHRGWIRVSHLETITNNRVRQRNLSDALKLTTATAAV